MTTILVIGAVFLVGAVAGLYSLRHVVVVDEPEEQKDMLTRFREAGG